jgi:hypothetical protein
MIDKFLESEGLTIKRNRLQLVGVAAMFTASKARACSFNLTKEKINARSYRRSDPHPLLRASLLGQNDFVTNNTRHCLEDKGPGTNLVSY